MKIPILTINQNDNIFYVGRIKARDLTRISTNKIRKNYTTVDIKNYLSEIDEALREDIEKGDIWYLKEVLYDPNIQRKQSRKRLEEIGKYISSSDSLFPNSIIINLSPRDETKEVDSVIAIEENEISFNDSEVVATIIDGQHRLGGFNHTTNVDFYLDNFELIVTIMIGLEISQQAELFGLINGKQTPVSKSVLYDLSEISENEYTEIVTAHLITKWFNVNESSPLFGKIKMLGYGEGSISQAAFIDALLPLLSATDYKELDPKQKIFPVFRDKYLKQDFKAITLDLYNYFRCFQEIFPMEWDYKLNKRDEVKYILNKTTGISGLLFAYPTIHAYFSLRSENSDNYLSVLQKIRGFDFSSKRYPGGNKQIQNQLADDILNSLFSDAEAANVRLSYLSKV